VQCEIVPLGIDTDKFCPGYREAASGWRKKLQIPDSAKVVVSIRAFTRLYSHDLILKAFGLAQRKLAGGSILVFRLYYHDPSDSYQQEIIKQAESFGVARFIRWMPAVPYERMPEVYALSDLLVNYPTMDAFPVSFIEAAACERAVVSCALPAYHGTFAENFFHMVPPGDEERLAEAMADELQIESPERSSKLARARRVVQRDYDETGSASKLLNLYQRVLN
jgi:glycosyltransferase involved in cell wall biosynthesis